MPNALKVHIKIYVKQSVEFHSLHKNTKGLLVFTGIYMNQTIYSILGQLRALSFFIVSNEIHIF